METFQVDLPLADPRATATGFIFAILTVVHLVTEVVVVDAKARVGASMVRIVGTNVLTFGLIFRSVAVDFSIASPRVRDALFTTLKTGG